ncbi:MAG: zinc ribbon domain-containing protein [Oscillospiraceae bacterium]|jgi:hypothetical protein|nr:zinc ribbon domain-containing protein [Oscillospiraceae bacterium]
MAFCRNCGNELPQASTFCNKCGTAVTPAVGAPPPQPIPQAPAYPPQAYAPQPYSYAPPQYAPVPPKANPAPKYAPFRIPAQSKTPLIAGLVMVAVGVIGPLFLHPLAWLANLISLLLVAVPFLIFVFWAPKKKPALMAIPIGMLALSCISFSRLIGPFLLFSVLLMLLRIVLLVVYLLTVTGKFRSKIPLLVLTFAVIFVHLPGIPLMQSLFFPVANVNAFLFNAVFALPFFLLFLGLPSQSAKPAAAGGENPAESSAS